MTKAASESACLVGKSYRTGGKVWRITADLRRHDGRFLFLRRDEEPRIIMQEVLLDRNCIIEGGVDEEGSGSQTGTKEIGGETAMCKGPADGDMEARQCIPVAPQGEVGSRDAGTRAGKGER